MKHSPFVLFTLVGLTAGLSGTLFAADPAPAKAPAAVAASKNQLPDAVEEAWAAVQKASQPPLPPAEWNKQKPTEEEIAKFKADMAKAAGKAADLAKEFYTRFEKDEKAGQAKEMERRMLAAAVSLGAKDREKDLEAAGGPPKPAPRAPQDELQKKLQEAAEVAMKKQSEGLPVVAVEFEKGIRALQKDFPDRPEIYGALLEIAELLPAERAIAVAKEVEEAKTEPELKQQAGAIRKKLEMVGKPVSIAFTATDGRKVDLLQMKGKVVLVDFWATWCGPCVAEIPNVKKAYDRLHEKGFEIVGISFDQDKDELLGFVKKKEMPWPQYFDGEGWGNKFGKEFGIRGIPTMWLVDKKGNLRDLNARQDLVGKVEKLLDE